MRQPVGFQPLDRRGGTHLPTAAERTHRPRRRTRDTLDTVRFQLHSHVVVSLRSLNQNHDERTPKEDGDDHDEAVDGFAQNAPSRQGGTPLADPAAIEHQVGPDDQYGIDADDVLNEQEPHRLPRILRQRLKIVSTLIHSIATSISRTQTFQARPIHVGTRTDCLRLFADSRKTLVDSRKAGAAPAPRFDTPAGTRPAAAVTAAPKSATEPYRAAGSNAHAVPMACAHAPPMPLWVHSSAPQIFGGCSPVRQNRGSCRARRHRCVRRSARTRTARAGRSIA